MEWTKIPTDLLQSRKSDKEILAITKYQLLWAMLERQPEDKIALRYMSPNQLKQALDYIEAIQQRINADIKSVSSHRNRQKIYYEKNQTLNKESDGHTDAQTDNHTDAQTDIADKIRIDKKKEINKENLVRYGEFGNVCLPEEYYTKLQSEHSQDEINYAVEKLDAWLDNPKQKNKLNKNHRGYFKKDSWVWEGFGGGYTRQFEGWENF
jgi:hypothetical protein